MARTRPTSLFVLAAISTSLALSVPAQAAPISWAAAVSGNWNDPTKWSPPQVPVAGDQVFITVAGTYTVTLNVNASPDSLVLGSSSGTQTLASTSFGLTLASPSRVTANGVLSMSSGNVSGAGTLSIQGNAAFRSVILNAPISNEGLVVMRGSMSVNGTLTTVPGSTLRIEGDVISGSGVATFATSFTNNATVELTNSSPGQGATIAVTSGTLTNAATHAINALAGAGGGARTIAAQLDNQGTLSMGIGLTLIKASAAHSNSGTINISGGDLTLTQSGTTPSFTNTGALPIASGRRIAMSSGTFNLNGGTIGGAGSTFATSSATVVNLGIGLSTANVGLDLATCTVNGPGTLTNAAGQTLPIRGCTINAPFDNLGVLVAHGSDAFNGALTTHDGSTLRIEGDATSGGATLTSAASFTNNGNIELTNASAGQGAIVAVTSGTLVNAANDTIKVLAGLGAGATARTIAAQLDNHGVISVGTPLTISKVSANHTNSGTIDVSGGDLALSQSGAGASFTNTGALPIASGRRITMTSGIFNFNAGTIGGSGSTFATASTTTINLGIGLSTGSVGLDLANCTVNGPGTLTNATGQTLPTRTCTFNATVDNQGLLVAHGADAVNGTLNTNPGSTLRIEGDGLSGGAVVTVVNGFTNSGNIELTNVSASQGATLTVNNGTLINAVNDTIKVLTGLGAGATARTITAQLDNRGVITIGTTLVLNKTSAAHLNSGKIDASGGDLTLSQSGTTPSFTNTGDLPIGSGHRIAMTGGTFSFNAGTIGGPGSSFSAIGTNTINLGIGLSTASVSLDLSNSTVNGPGTLTNAAGSTLLTRTCTFNAPFDNFGTLVTHATDNVNGSLATHAGSTLRIEGDGISGSGGLTLASGFTNNGNIELTNISAGQGATVSVTSGTLVNAPNDSIKVLPGLGAGATARTIAAQLDNQGVVAASAALTIAKASAAHSNSGRFDLSGGDLTVTQSGTTPSFTTSGVIAIGAGHFMSVTAGTLVNTSVGTIGGSGTLNVSTTAFTNRGHLAPGASPGILSITGTPALTDSGSIDIEIGGANAGTDYDRLAFAGLAPLAGTLHVGLINGFVPTPGQSFLVVTYGSHTGALATFTGLDLGGGLSFLPQVSATGITLLTVGQTWVHEVPLGGNSSLARAQHTAVMDPGNNRMIVFGGTSASAPLNDVWVLTNADNTGGAPTWTKLTTAGGPPGARANHTAVYDAASNRMIVYGGDNATGPSPALFGDVWVLTNANGLGGAPTWSQLSPAGGPPPARTEHSAVYDAANNRMIVFGGNESTPCGTGLNDVWVLANANGLGGAPAWSQLSPAGGPPSARSHALATYDPATNRMTVVGGLTPCGASNNEMWVLADANGIGAPTWTQLSPGGTPLSPWSLQSAVYDASLDRISVFGGLTGSGLTNTVLTLTDGNGDPGPPTWVDLTPTSGPPDPRSNHSAVQASNHRMIVFGGLGASGRLSDVWVLEQTQGRVTDVPLPPAPGPVATRTWTTGFTRAPSPNPSASRMQFAISVARAEHVELSLWDVAGRRVATLERGNLEAGEHHYEWRGETASGRARAGLYFLRFDAEDAHLSRRVVVTH
jgi:hypothetical protein